MKANLLFIILYFFFIGESFVFAQAGSIKGVIRDAKTQEAIIGGNVVIKGTTTGASTNLEGEYIIPKVGPGTYTISISYISYKTKDIANITVPPGKTIILNATIEEDAAVLEGVVITAERITSSEVSVINEVREAEQVVTGISAEQINKSQDNNAAEVIQRVPGVSIVDNRFVMIRGLSERYNNVMINDAISPSTEVDSRAFSFDLVPSNIIDRMLIFKSGSPEYPGDFAGGVIKIFTKSVPNENATTLSLNLGNRFGTTFEQFQLNRVGSRDFLAFDDGTRALPSSFPTNLGDLSITQANAVARDLNNNFGFDKFTARPDGSATLGVSRKMNIGSMRLTTVSQLSYSSKFQFARIQRFRYLAFSDSLQRSETQFEYEDENYSQSTRVGAITNWSLVVNENFKLDFRNMFNQLSENEMVFREGRNTIQRENDLFNNYAFRYMSRSILSSQLQGKHSFNKDRTNLTWVGGYSYIRRNEPDFRRIRYFRPVDNPNAPFTNIDPPNAALFDNARFYSTLTENTYMHSLSADHKVLVAGTSEENPTFLTLKGGYYLENKARDFSARWFSYSLPSTLDPVKANELRRLPVDQIFNPSNIGIDGWRYNEGTNPSDKYTASTTIAAGYAGASLPLRWATIATGARVENSLQLLDSRNRNEVPINVNLNVTRLLPSVNFGFNLNEKNILRAAYCRTINRPEFRELAEFLYYDFNLEANVVGNPNLKVATIDNFDIRWEFYPTEAEIISIGGFLKNFDSPIETYIRQAGESQQFEFGNAVSAQSLGAEIEFRKSFATWTSAPVLSDLGVNINASIIRSTVDLGAVVAQDKNRILQGQSPYLINAALYYTKLENGVNASLVYNVFGPRIFTVGDNLFPTVYELPRHTIDLTLNKKLTKRIEGKLGIQDLLNYQYRFYQDSNRDTRIDTSVDEPIFLFRRGSVFTMGLSIKL